MKRLSLQWRITIMTALLTCAACVLTNCLVGYTGTVSYTHLDVYKRQPLIYTQERVRIAQKR